MDILPKENDPMQGVAITTPCGFGFHLFIRRFTAIVLFHFLQKNSRRTLSSGNKNSYFLNSPPYRRLCRIIPC